MLAFRVQERLQPDGSLDWTWGVFDDDSGYALGYGAAPTLRAVAAEIRSWYLTSRGYPAETDCECGSTGIYTAFEPGHGRWCPVAPDRIIIWAREK